LKVFLTIDTEAYPLTPRWKESQLREDLDRDVYGRCSDGEFGLKYQLQVLAHHKLTAVFFVEPLFASVPEIGIAPLRKIISLVSEAGHDIQLHPHPEWLAFIPNFINGRNGHLINGLSCDQQRQVIAKGTENLIVAGAARPCAFRAGDFAADVTTLRALTAEGIRFDSSYNISYLESWCRIETVSPLVQPAQLEGIWEFPVAHFEDFPGHYRPAQLSACSDREMIFALEQAYDCHWSSFVIVSHSFELIMNRRNGQTLRARPSAVHRFQRLCSFLDKNRDRFQTANFADLRTAEINERENLSSLRGKFFLTARRMGEQLLDRIR
jgi:hypothetical protein